MEKISIKSRKTISHGHAKLEKIRYEIEHYNGSTSGQEREVYDHGNAVAVLLYDRESRKVLLTQQFRLPTFLNGNPTGMLLEVCAGIVEEAEEPAVTMKREILEETGYQVENLVKVYEAYSSAGVLTEMLSLFTGTYSSGNKKAQGGGLKEEGEEIKNVELDFDEAIEMLKKNQIRDVKTIILLQYMLINHLIEENK
ncbi:MAG: NUDIX domain-containing protein [Flavisolibacter sp.]|jgi:nudix-type nucleoside diphosphatase (YffH/AdpP family)|nr:NUDIX domain-containing protein [Flavisolibacter sp.]